LFVASRI